MTGRHPQYYHMPQYTIAITLQPIRLAGFPFA